MTPFDTSDKLKIVLVHGAFSDASGWAHVIPILQDAGHSVVAVQNDLESLKGDVANTRAVVDQQTGPVLLVGHSYGGAVISGAAYGAKNVVGLVYVAAYAPDEGEQIGALNEKFPAPRAASYFVSDAHDMLYIDPQHFAEAFAADAPPVEGRTMGVTQRPIAGAIFGESAGPAAWHDVKTWFAVSADDITINPDLERFFAQRMNATTITLQSSHASLVAHPAAVADFIMKAADDCVARQASSFALN